jgi:prepilin-type N-terminal cleavage/methylation domain-containing protein
MKKNSLGFTLIELMITMSIIAILSVVLSISFSKAQKSGRDQRRIDDLKGIQNAAEQYYSLAGTYPTAGYSYGQQWKAAGQIVLQSYPKDPKDSSPYVYTISNVTTSSYCVCAFMENSNNSMSANMCDFTNPNGGYFCVKNQQ